MTDFKAVLATNGIPEDETAAEAAFRALAFAESSPFNNQSPYSPFWKLVTQFAVKPVVAISNLLSNEILPALFLKTATGTWIDIFAWQLNLTRKAATKATGRITFSRYESTGSLLVPAGTTVQSAEINGEVYRLTTLNDAVFDAGVLSVDVIAEAEETGSQFNLATGFYSLLTTEFAGVVNVSNDESWLLVPGAEAESDEDLVDRCRNQFAATNNWHIDFAYIGMVTQWAGVAVNDVFIESDAPRGAGTGNIYILFDQAAPASTWLDEMTSFVMDQGNHGFSDDVLIQSIPYFDMPQKAYLGFDSSVDEDAAALLKEDIEHFIYAAFRQLPNTGYTLTQTAPNTVFAWSKLITQLHNTFDSLISIDFENDENIPAQLAQPQLSLTAVIV